MAKRLDFSPPMVGKRIRFIDGSYTLSKIEGVEKLTHLFLGSDKTTGVIVEEGNFPADIKINNTYTNRNKYKVKGDDGNIHYCSDYNFEIIY